MTIEAGQQLLHYRLIEKIGEGGMGVVWKALDTTLQRHVAIKILPPQFTSDNERMARFEREAKLLASLNHPGIAVYVVPILTVGIWKMCRAPTAPHETDPPRPHDRSRRSLRGC